MGSWRGVPCATWAAGGCSAGSGHPVASTGDPTGVALLAAHVCSRDGVCISPVCHHPAHAGGTQLDHTTAWGPATPTRLRGGLTEAGNLGCICQRWHTAKTHGGWDLHQPSPGSSTWTSPTGRVYHRRSTPLLPDLADALP